MYVFPPLVSLWEICRRLKGQSERRGMLFYKLYTPPPAEAAGHSS